MTITFRRILHPVGQGAFFTEQIIDKESQKILLNVVYDCGNLTPSYLKKTQRLINDIYEKKRSIDLLFISHFDNDHINRVSYLIENKYLDNNSIVFIPLIEYEEYLFTLNIIKDSLYDQFINDLKDNKISVITIKEEPEEDDGIQRNDPININLPLETSVKQNVRPFKRLKDGTKLDSGTRINITYNSDSLWSFVPFNIPNKAVITEFREKLNANGLDATQLSNFNYIKKNKKTLKKIYKETGVAPTQGTRINLNSLQLLSFPDEIHALSYVENYFFHCNFLHWTRGMWLYNSNVYWGACLYTGDTSSNEKFVWNKICHIIDEYLKKPVYMFQIPHHGSKYSYNEKIEQEERIFCAFTNFYPYYHQHIFDSNIVSRFLIAHKPLFLITHEYVSRYEDTFIIGEKLKK